MTASSVEKAAAVARREEKRVREVQEEREERNMVEAWVGLAGTSVCSEVPVCQSDGLPVCNTPHGLGFLPD